MVSSLVPDPIEDIIGGTASKAFDGMTSFPKGLYNFFTDNFGGGDGNNTAEPTPKLSDYYKSAAETYNPTANMEGLEGQVEGLTNRYDGTINKAQGLQQEYLNTGKGFVNSGISRAQDAADRAGSVEDTMGQMNPALDLAMNKAAQQVKGASGNMLDSISTERNIADSVAGMALDEYNKAYDRSMGVGKNQIGVGQGVANTGINYGNLGVNAGTSLANMGGEQFQNEANLYNTLYGNKRDIGDTYSQMASDENIAALQQAYANRQMDRNERNMWERFADEYLPGPIGDVFSGIFG